MGCGDVRLLRTIGGVDVTGQERATLNKLTMPAAVGQQILDILEAQAVSVLHPDGVAAAVRRNALPKVAESSNVQPGIVPRGA